MTQNNQEIDIINFLKISYSFVCKRYKIILVFAVASFIIGFWGYKRSKIKYHNSFIVTTNLKTKRNNNVISTDIQPLYSVLFYISENSRNKAFLEKELNVPGNKIEIIKIELLKDKFLTTNEIQYILISATVLDTAVFRNLQMAIIKYCQNNSYLKKIAEDQRKMFYLQANEFEKYKNKIDSLMSIKTQTQATVIFDFTTLLESLQFYSQVNDMNTTIIDVVNNFSKYPIVKNRKLAFGLAYFLGSFMLLLFSLILFEIVKNEKN